MTRIDELPAVLTCFAYRREYFAELDGMLATIKQHHPNWLVVTGRGPVSGFDLPTLDVEWPSGKCRWTMPVALHLDGSENDWRKITRMKAWWLARVWHQLGDVTGAGLHRLVWVDADARLNGPLDTELDPEAEVVAGPWWVDPATRAHDTICSGLLVFQGARHGKIEAVLDQWSSRCLDHIQRLPPPTVPWLDGDQEVLNDVLQSYAESSRGFLWLKLDHEKYAGLAADDGTPPRGALVEHWLMSRKMKLPENRDRCWPPPEEARRPSAHDGQ